MRSISDDPGTTGPEAPRPATGYDVSTSLELPHELHAEVNRDVDRVLVGLRYPWGIIESTLDEANLPLMQELFDATPVELQPFLENWLDRAFSDHRGILGGIRLERAFAAVLGHVNVIGDIDLTSGRYNATQLEFAVQSKKAFANLVDLEEVSGLSIAASVAAPDGHTVIIEEHGFALDYGPYAWDAAFELANVDATDMRDVLGQLVDCGGVAREVAARGFDGLTVGQEVELRTLCELALDRIEAQLHERVASLRWNEVRFSRGVATVDRDLHDGRCTVIIDAGQGPQEVLAELTGRAR